MNICYCRNDLAKEERTLQTVRSLTNKKKATLHAAKNKVQKLKEQLEAAERIVAISEKHIDTYHQQVI